ncbi:unnamed protein product [Closterium sp. NIES-65]|nr:unnamed protein product [Closterium sp. NIES-65]
MVASLPQHIIAATYAVAALPSLRRDCALLACGSHRRERLVASPPPPPPPPPPPSRRRDTPSPPPTPAAAPAPVPPAHLAATPRRRLPFPLPRPPVTASPLPPPRLLRRRPRIPLPQRIIAACPSRSRDVTSPPPLTAAVPSSAPRAHPVAATLRHRDASSPPPVLPPRLRVAACTPRRRDLPSPPAHPAAATRSSPPARPTAATSRHCLRIPPPRPARRRLHDPPPRPTVAACTSRRRDLPSPTAHPTTATCSSPPPHPAAATCSSPPAHPAVATSSSPPPHPAAAIYSSSPAHPVAPTAPPHGRNFRRRDYTASRPRSSLLRPYRRLLPFPPHRLLVPACPRHPSADSALSIGTPSSRASAVSSRTPSSDSTAFSTSSSVARTLSSPLPPLTPVNPLLPPFSLALLLLNLPWRSPLPQLQAAADATFLHNRSEYLIRKAEHEVAVHHHEFATAECATRVALLTERCLSVATSALFQEYFSITLATYDGTVDYVGRMQEVVDRLAARQAALPEPLQIHRLLYNLTPDYESHLHSFTKANPMGGLSDVCPRHFG